MTVNYYTNRKDFNREGRWGDSLVSSLPKSWRRNHTWDVASEIESQSTSRDRHPDEETVSPITHSQTAPGRVGETIPESIKETDVQDMEPFSSQSADSGGSSADSPVTTRGGPSDAPDLLRRRVPSNKEESRTSPRAMPDRVPRETDGEPKKSRTFFKHLTPKEPFTVGNQLRRTLLYSPLNILIVAAPVGIAINYVPSIPRVAVFVVNFLAIVPLAALLSYGTEEVALRLGETLGGLLNASLGNAVEL